MAEKAKAGTHVADMDKKKVKEAFEAIMAKSAEIRTLKASHAKRVGNLTEVINGHKDHAKDAGCDKKVFDLVLEEAENRRSVKEKREALEPHQQDMFDELCVSLKLTDDDFDKSSAGRSAAQPENRAH